MVNCVYVHIPFCVKKCNYCAFCSYSGLFYKEKYLDALLKEIKFYYKNNLLKTIYFGGGTPSLLEPSDINTILKCLNFNQSTEITIEVNPNNLTYDKLAGYKDIGINRISVGVQNFDDTILKSLGRIHNVRDIYNSIENIKSSGFDNYSIDLMYGLPGQDLNNWKDTISLALDLNPSHISLYGLKIEPKTKFYKLYKNYDSSALQDIQADMYNYAVEKLNNSYIHYEFSNFAKTNRNISTHNLAYWKREEYFGFGLSASGFYDNKRYTNTFNMKEYINNPLKKAYHSLSKQEQIEEEIFLGLRLSEGINFNKINEKYGIDIYDKYKNEFDKFLKYKYFEQTDVGIKLTLSGILVSNEILCEFINV